LIRASPWDLLVEGFCTTVLVSLALGYWKKPSNLTRMSIISSTHKPAFIGSLDPYLQTLEYWSSKPYYLKMSGGVVVRFLDLWTADASSTNEAF
jgi:hypothetical protein